MSACEFWKNDPSHCTAVSAAPEVFPTDLTAVSQEGKWDETDT